jgi:hypothetical protein
MRKLTAMYLEPPQGRLTHVRSSCLVRLPPPERRIAHAILRPQQDQSNPLIAVGPLPTNRRPRLNAAARTRGLVGIRRVVAGARTAAAGGRPQAGLEERREGCNDGGTLQLIALVPQRRAARAANAGTWAILSWSRCSQRMPDGRCGSVHQLASSAVTMRSTRKSWRVSGGLVHYLERVDGGGQHRVWPKHAASTRKATSRSENPPPLPTRAPWRFTRRCRRRPGPPMAARWRRPCAQPWPPLPWRLPPTGHA